MRALPGTEEADTSRMGEDARRRTVPAAPDTARAAPTPFRISQGQRVQPDHIVVSFECRTRVAGELIQPRVARRVEQMRRIAAAHLRHWGLDRLTEPAVLVVSELVTKALVHNQGGAVDFALSYANDTVRIAVSVGSPGQPRKQDVSPDSKGGRGLFLVDWIATEHDGEWGTTGDGKTTYCTLAAPEHIHDRRAELFGAQLRYGENGTETCPTSAGLQHTVP